MMYSTVFSPDDGGWYSEVYHYSGRTAHQTDIFDTKEEASEAAVAWIATA